MREPQPKVKKKPRLLSPRYRHGFYLKKSLVLIQVYTNLRFIPIHRFLFNIRRVLPDNCRYFHLFVKTGYPD